ncbi:MAG: DUF1207 domain-containing protein [Gammaproteobacteria bacterium]|nr:DUF1207 domain-containing protein [Gammaproteobacteria bacterium]
MKCNGTIVRLFPLLLLLPTGASAQQPAEPPPSSENLPRLQLAPTEHIYPPYLADQKRVTFGLQVLHVMNSTIPETSNSRFALRLGGRLELFNWSDDEDPAQQLQANLEVGFLGHFDIDHSQDNIGWDGNYGLIFSYRHNTSVAYRFGFYHDSSHVGDEYAERTGRKRISYTREEVLLGAQYSFSPRWQTYFELGAGYHQDEKPLQDRYRVQTGLQYQQSQYSTSERLGWYAGIDLSAYEENDWSINRALQFGFAFDAAPHVWRIALDYYRGRSSIGEFFQFEEEYIGLSLYLDV